MPCILEIFRKYNCRKPCSWVLTPGNGANVTHIHFYRFTDTEIYIRLEAFTDVKNYTLR